MTDEQRLMRELNYFGIEFTPDEAALALDVVTNALMASIGLEFNTDGPDCKDADSCRTNHR